MTSRDIKRQEGDDMCADLIGVLEQLAAYLAAGPGRDRPVRAVRRRREGPCAAERHGDRNAYYMHGCVCQDARDACALYERRRTKEKKLGRPRAVTALGSVRRLQALNRMGWTMKAIAAAGGMDARYLAHIVRGSNHAVYRETDRKVRAVYDRLHMVPGPSMRGKAHAIGKGYAPPLAWDDIDDPDEKPATATARRPEWDECRWGDVDHLRSFGVPDGEIAARLGISLDGLEKAERRAGRRASETPAA